MSGTARLLERLSDGKFHSHEELYRDLGIMVHSRAANLRKRGHVIHVRREWSPSQRRNFWFYRLDARQTGSVGPSVSEESGSTGDPADPVGRVPQTVTFPERQVASASALSPSPSTTPATGLPVGEPETRPQTLFDMPANPSWA